MIDFYLHLRQRMIDTMQSSLKQVRQVLGFGVQEFGDVIGLTRQTINNLENKKNAMSATQYVAICAIIDSCTKDRPEILPILSTLLQLYDESGNAFETNQNGSFLKKWFLCFPDESKIIGFSQEESDLLNEKDFDTIADRYKIFLDDSIVSDKAFFEAIQPLVPGMRLCENRFIVPMKVVEKIQNQMLADNGTQGQNARIGMKNLMELQAANLVELRGDEDDVTVLNTFISVFAKFKCMNRIALLTQDPLLAKQVMALNDDAFGGFHILVLRFENQAMQQWTPEDFLQESSNDTKAFPQQNAPQGWAFVNHEGGMY